MSRIGKIRALVARPIESADLGFESSGVLTFRRATVTTLGTRVSAFDPESVLDHLGDTSPGDSARLRFDARTLKAIMKGGSLYALRNDSIAASLDQAILQRRVSVLQRYSHADFISSEQNRFYGAADGPESRVARLSRLKQAIVDRRTSLDAAYAGEEKVLKETESITTPAGVTITESFSTPVATTGGQTSVFDGPELKEVIRGGTTEPSIWQVNDWKALRTNEYLASRSVSKYPAGDSQFLQRTKMQRDVYRVPAAETAIEFERSMIDVEDKLLEAQLQSRRSPSASSILLAELGIIDAEVRKLQLDYIHSYLVSPISGVVTAVHKEIGETIGAGEPVVRVENDEKLLLIGVIQFRGMLRIGSKASLSLSDLHEANDPLKIQGAEVVAIRGHDTDNDEWELTMLCSNPVGEQQSRLIPINYTFDRDSTTIEFE